MSNRPLPWLGQADWLMQPQTQAVFAALAAAGFEARAVGGPVRNALLGLPVTDIDIATTARPEQTIAAAAVAGLASVPTGVDHGTVTVISSHVPFEVTTLRKDVATDGRRAVVAFTQDWAEDACRRDFTMNALYCSARGTVSDPLGGFDDVMMRRVRFIGEAATRIAEDYLRILRFFRFHAMLGAGLLDAEGVRACVRSRAGLRQLSAERIGAEIVKLIAAPRATETLEVMFAQGLLVDVIPAAPNMIRFVRLVDIEAATGQRPNAMLRLNALAVHVAEDAGRLAHRLRLSGEQQSVLALAPLPVTGDAAVRQARAALYRLGPAVYRLRLHLAWAASRDAPKDGRWLNLDGLVEHAPIPVFPMSGRDLLTLGLQPGPAMGELLRTLENQWIASDFTTGVEVLRAEASRFIADLRRDRTSAS